MTPLYVVVHGSGADTLPIDLDEVFSTPEAAAKVAARWNERIYDPKPEHRARVVVYGPKGGDAA